MNKKTRQLVVGLICVAYSFIPEKTDLNIALKVLSIIIDIAFWVYGLSLIHKSIK